MPDGFFGGRAEGIEPQPTVLETVALPIELHLHFRTSGKTAIRNGIATFRYYTN